MKPETRSFDVQSTMAGEKIAMGIRVEDMSHIMGVMTDLYKNRLLAVIREYSTNAWDAHQEAGVSLPIEVTLPSSFAPFLKIRDYGCGLDADDIRTVYSQYGRSTKRASNDQVGMLGLGCKSALTYTTQFTVASVKDGRRVTVLVARDEEGAGTMQILGDESTQDANGTEVTVAVRRDDLSRCEREARDFFAYWTPGAVLLNGKPPERFEGLKLSDSIYLIEGGGRDSNKIVMGNVAYPATISLNITTAASIVAFVPIGSVKPTPAREALMDTASTKQTLADVVTEFHACIAGAIQREVDRAATPQAAIKAIVKWKQYVPSNAKAATYTYQGKPIPEAHSVPTNPTRPYDYAMRTVTFRDGYWKKSATNGTNSIPVASWPTSVWVSNFAPEKFTAQHKNKLKAWAEEAGLTDATCSQFVLLSGDAPVSDFIDPAMVAPWEVVRKIKLTSSVAGTGHNYGRLTGSFDIFTEYGWKSEVPGDDLRQGEPLFWSHGNRWENDRYDTILKALYPKYTLVCLSRNRIAKFTRETTTAVKVRDGLDAAFATWVKKQSQDDLKAIAMHDACVGVIAYGKLDPARLNDPALREAIALAKRDVRSLMKARDAFRGVVNIGGMNVKAAHPLGEYPLFNERFATHDHSYLYLNAAFAAKSA